MRWNGHDDSTNDFHNDAAASSPSNARAGAKIPHPDRGGTGTAGDMTEEMPLPDPVTRLLLDWTDGDEHSRDEMLPLVYDELRRLATLYLLRERRDHTLQPTALVHEAYLRLVDQRQVNWKNRAQFVGLAAVMMRRILVNHARDRAADTPLPLSSDADIW